MLVSVEELKYKLSGRESSLVQIYC